MTNNLTPEQQQQLGEIGSHLQRLRLAKSISLDSVAAKTLISKRLLEAIEIGDFDELPEHFYIKALVSKFAQAIGAQQVKFELDAAVDLKVIKSDSKQEVSRKYWFDFQLRSLHLYLLYILLVVISVKGITILVERPIIINEAPIEKPIIESTTTQVNATQNAISPPPAPQFISQSNTTESVTVGINLQERCWLKVMVDGEVAFEGILPKGTQRQWHGEKQVTIRAGNAGGVVISFNNQQQQVLGAPGEVEEITYTVN